MKNELSGTGNKVGRTNTNKTNDFIKQLEEAEKIAKYVVNSDTYGVAFEKRVAKTDDKGKPILDENGKEQWITLKNENDVIAAIMIGQELGLSPMASIAVGKKLNKDAFTKVKRGKALGIDPITALDVIDIISTSNGDITHTGVHVITKVLLDNDVKIEFLKSYDPHYIYYKAGTVEEVQYDESIHFVVNRNTTSEELKANKDKVLVTRVFTRISTVRLTRGEQSITTSYTLQQATDAGLYKGKSTDGKTVDGKSNWNNHPATMLDNRVITIAGRRIVADKLLNTYSHEEAAEFTDYEEVEPDNPHETINEYNQGTNEDNNTISAQKID